MRLSILKKLALAATMFASAVGIARSQTITVDGTLDAAYGSALAVQTVNTSANADNTTTGGNATGSELDAAYGVVSGGNLYVFITGNFQNNGNRMALFIADGRAGQSTFSYPSGSISHFNGSQFSPGFSCTFAMDLNLNSYSVNVSEYLLVTTTGVPASGSQGAFAISSSTGIGSGSPNSQGWTAPITIALNNNNTGGVTYSSTGTAANQAAAAAVTTGYEMVIPLSDLGNPTGPIKVMALMTGSSDQGLYNQFLPGLTAPHGSVGGNTFDFSSTANGYFTVANSSVVPVVSITAPASNANFAPGSNIAITANASEAGGAISNVAFYANSTLLGNATSSPYSLTWSNVPAGSYALTAVATDATGGSTTSSVVNITVAMLEVYDDASAYGSNWTSGANLGYGFQPWVLVGGGQYNGFLIQSSGNINTSGESWDMYANGTGSPYAIAYRGFNNALATGQVFSVKFQNTAISSGDMGFCLRSDNNTNFVNTSIITNPGTRFAFYIAAGQTDYSIWNGNGVIDSGIASRTSGLSLQLHLLTANTYEIVVKTADGSTTLATFTSAPLAGASGSAIQTFACFNLATASFQDTYFNSLQVSSGGFSGGPVVSILVPTNNADFAPGSSIAVTANATESGGAISNVAFYANSTPLGHVSSAPYSLTWSSVPAGSYALTAVASDTVGNATTSTVGYVVVSATVAYDDAFAYGSSWANGENLGFGFQPWVLMQNNNGGPTYAGFFTGSSGNIDTSGWAWGMYANGTGSPYAIAYRGFNSGLTTTEVFKVQFQNTDIDAGGEMGFCLRSDDNTSFVDTSIITNAGTRFAFYFVGGQTDYYIWNGHGLTDSGIAFTSTGLSLEFYLDPADTYEMIVKTADGSTTLATFTSAPLAGASGAAIQTFAGFNVGSGSSQNAFFNSLQIAPPAPVVSITSPTNNADFVPGSSLAITATASVRGGTIASVAFYANSTLLGLATSAPYSLIWSNAPAGSYILTAVATDATGNTTTSSAVNITVGPVVSITSPVNNANITPGSNIAITANASETGGAIANVEFYANSTLLGIVTSAPYSLTWSSVPAGDYALTAVATDATGASTTSSVMNITVSVVFVPSQIKTVFVIPLENHDWVQGCPTCSPQQIFGNPAAPYVNSLVTPGNSNSVHVSYATKYYSVNITGEHPSEPNYIWSEAGTDFGVHTDNDPSTGSGNLYSTPNHLCRQLTDAGIVWKDYQEDLEYCSSAAVSAAGTRPSGTNIYNGSNQYDRGVKHDPMQFYTDTQGKNVYTLAQFWTDLTNNAVGRYNWITPDQYNEMHSSLPSYTYHGTTYSGDQAAIAEGDNFLSIAIPKIMASAAYQDHGVIIIWTDETESTDDTNTTLPYIIISPLAKGNAYASNVALSHSSDLKMMDEIFGLPYQTNAIPTGELDAQNTGYNYVDGRSATVNDLSDMFRECAPSFVSQPASSTNNAGTNVCFNVGATACAQLSYQWYFGTNVLAGETNSTLCIASVGPANVGNYHVVVTSGGVAMNSAPATLTVDYQTPNIVGGQMMLSGSGFQLTFSGPEGQTYQVLASDNMTAPLSEWTVIGSGTFSNTNVVFTDTDAANHTSRFYIITSP